MIVQAGAGGGGGGGGGITGSGTANKIAKFTGATAIGNSAITDNGSSITISYLAGSGSGFVAVDNSGVLSFSAGAGSTALSAITAAIATNTIDSLNFAQIWGWSTLSTQTGFTWTANALSTGTLFSLTSTSTAAASNTQTILNIALSGTNGTSTQTTYGAKISNTHAGTGSTNVALQLTSSGGVTDSYALVTTAGKSGFNTTTPTGIVHIKGVGTTTGQTVLVTNSTPATLFSIKDDGTFTLGISAIATNSTSVPVGQESNAGNGGIAIGYQANSSGGIAGISFGYQTIASNTSSIAIGSFSNTSGGAGIGIGASTVVSMLDGIAIGELSRATALGSIIIGSSNQGAVTNDIQGSLRIALSWLAGTRIAKKGFFIYNKASTVLAFDSTKLVASNFDTSHWQSLPFDTVAENVLSLENPHTPTILTVTSVTDHSTQGAWFTSTVATDFDQPNSGVKVQLAGSAVYANGTYYAHWQTANTASLHTTRIDALNNINPMVYISNPGTDGSTVTFYPLTPDPTLGITGATQLYSINTDDNKASLGIQAEQLVVNEVVVSDRTLKVQINGVQYKLCLKV